MYGVCTVAALCVVLLAGTAEGRASRQRRSLDRLRWHSCGASNSVFQLHSLNLHPMPVVIPGVAHLTLNASSSRSVTDMKVEVEIEKMLVGNYGVSIPCIQGFGSCDIPSACDLLDDALASDEEVVQEMLDILRDNDVSLACPMPALRLTTHRHRVDLTDVPLIGTLITGGEYKVKLRFLEHTSNVELGCFVIRAESASPPINILDRIQDWCFFC